MTAESVTPPDVEELLALLGISEQKRDALRLMLFHVFKRYSRIANEEIARACAERPADAKTIHDAYSRLMPDPTSLVDEGSYRAWVRRTLAATGAGGAS